MHKIFVEVAVVNRLPFPLILSIYELWLAGREVQMELEPLALKSPTFPALSISMVCSIFFICRNGCGMTKEDLYIYRTGVYTDIHIVKGIEVDLISQNIPLAQ